MNRTLYNLLTDVQSVEDDARLLKNESKIAQRIVRKCKALRTFIELLIEEDRRHDLRQSARRTGNVQTDSEGAAAGSAGNGALKKDTVG